VKVCWVLNPLRAPAAATYENEHGFKPRRQGILANFCEAVHKETMTDSATTADEKAQGHVGTPE